MTKLAGDRAAMAQNIERLTGRSVRDWVVLLQRTRLETHGDLVSLLKREYALTHGYANLLALAARPSVPEGSTAEVAVAQQFAGAKAGLRPLYDRLVEVVRRLGADVEIAPKRANVSIRRRRQFALFQASTAMRLDVGLILPGETATDRLERSGTFNAMFTHRVRLAHPRDVDAELGRWLRRAYDLAG